MSHRPKDIAVIGSCKSFKIFEEDERRKLSIDNYYFINATHKAVGLRFDGLVKLHDWRGVPRCFEIIDYIRAHMRTEND